MYCSRVLVAFLFGVLLQTTQAAAVVNADIDIDGDGTICFEEFLDLMEQYYEKADKNKDGKTTLGEIRAILASALELTGTDGGDAATPTRCKGSCTSNVFKGDGDCDEVNNCKGCAWDGGDCANPDEEQKVAGGKCKGKCGRDIVKGDGDCDETNNCKGCDWDGGDCESEEGIDVENYDGPVHILHIAKAGGLSLRNAIGCSCPERGGRAHCEDASTKGQFICHGHQVTCKDIPDGEPYVVFFRDPITRFLSANRYQNSLSPTPISLATTLSVTRHQRPQHDYVDCEHKPSFVGHLETMDEDYQAFLEKFSRQCASIGCAASIPHDHKLSKGDEKDFLPNDLRHRFFVKYAKDFSIARVKK